MTRIAFFGAGVMGETILAGILRGGHAPDDLAVVERSAERAAAIEATHGVRAREAVDALRWADVVFLVTKPQDLPTLLEQVGHEVTEGTLLISLAAGLTTSRLEGLLPEGTAVARVMPNTPALLGEGMSAISAGRHCSPAQVAQVAELLAPSGRTVVVPEEQQDAVTAVSGSGPAYVFYLCEAMQEAGVALGLPPETAAELAVQTLYGAATMLRESGQDPATLRRRVTSPGGTTAEAIGVLDARDVREAVAEAMAACARRSAELAG